MCRLTVWVHSQMSIAHIVLKRHFHHIGDWSDHSDFVSKTFSRRDARRIYVTFKHNIHVHLRVHNIMS